MRAGASALRCRAPRLAPVPGSVPAALYEPLVARLYATPAALPVAAAAAAAGQEVDRVASGRGHVDRADELDPTLPRPRRRHRSCEPVAGRGPGTSSATSCCARSPTSCSLLRGAARSTPARRPPQPRRAERLARPRLALRARGAPPRGGRGIRAARRSGHAGAARWPRRAPTSQRAIDLVAPLDERCGARPSRGRSSACAAVSSRWRPRARPSADASADFDRCLELAAADPPGDDMFSTLISLWAALPLARRARPRPRDVTATAAGLAGGQARRTSGPRISAASGCSTGSAGGFAGAVDGALRLRPRRASRRARTRSSPPPGSCPTTRRSAMHVHLALARFMAADVAGADESLARARARRGGARLPAGPVERRLRGVARLVDVDRGRPARPRRSGRGRSARVERPARVRRLGAHRRRRRPRRSRASRALRSGPADARRAARARRRRRRPHRVWQMLELRVFLPFYITTARRAARRGGRHRRGAAALRGVARSSPPRPACASTTPRRCGASPSRARPRRSGRAAAHRARPRPRRRRRARSSCGSRSTCTSSSARRRARCSSSAIAAFDARDATSDLDEARARLLIPR